MALSLAPVLSGSIFLIRPHAGLSIVLLSRAYCNMPKSFAEGEVGGGTQ